MNKLNMKMMKKTEEYKTLNNKYLQENFIEELENRGKENIKNKHTKIDELDQSVAKHY